MEWEILMTSEVEDFLDDLLVDDPETHRLVNQSILILERAGPAVGRPIVDRIQSSNIANLKELRPPSRGQSEIRILFAFDPWRSAILLIAGDKSGEWTRWYRDAIPAAERRYAVYLEERRREIDDERN
jgi:hypothetical protein